MTARGLAMPLLPSDAAPRSDPQPHGLDGGARTDANGAASERGTSSYYQMFMKAVHAGGLHGGIFREEPPLTLLQCMERAAHECLAHVDEALTRKGFTGRAYEQALGRALDTFASWTGAMLDEETQRIIDAHPQIDTTLFYSVCKIYVREIHADAIASGQRVSIRPPAFSDFVREFFRRLASDPYVRSAAYFDRARIAERKLVHVDAVRGSLEQCMRNKVTLIPAPPPPTPTSTSALSPSTRSSPSSLSSTPSSSTSSLSTSSSSSTPSSSTPSSSLSGPALSTEGRSLALGGSSATRQFTAAGDDLGTVRGSAQRERNAVHTAGRIQTLTGPSGNLYQQQQQQDVSQSSPQTMSDFGQIDPMGTGRKPLDHTQERPQPGLESPGYRGAFASGPSTKGQRRATPQRPMLAERHLSLSLASQGPQRTEAMQGAKGAPKRDRASFVQDSTDQGSTIDVSSPSTIPLKDTDVIDHRHAYHDQHHQHQQQQTQAHQVGPQQYGASQIRRPDIYGHRLREPPAARASDREQDVDYSDATNDANDDNDNDDSSGDGMAHVPGATADAGGQTIGKGSVGGIWPRAPMMPAFGGAKHGRARPAIRLVDEPAPLPARYLARMAAESDPRRAFAQGPTALPATFSPLANVHALPTGPRDSTDTARQRGFIFDDRGGDRDGANQGTMGGIDARVAHNNNRAGYAPQQQQQQVFPNHHNAHANYEYKGGGNNGDHDDDDTTNNGGDVMDGDDSAWSG